MALCSAVQWAAARVGWRAVESVDVRAAVMEAAWVRMKDAHEAKPKAQKSVGTTG